MTATRIVSVPPATIQAAAVSPAFAARLAARMMPQQEWIDRHASGTLRKNARLGMRHRSQYMEERTAWEFGWEWQCVPSSRVTLGDAITEGDCSAITEGTARAWAWCASRHRPHSFRVVTPCLRSSRNGTMQRVAGKGR
jgi:hypothetical protein